MLWMLERGVYGHDASGPHPLEDAALACGHNVLAWESNALTPPVMGPVMFHGSMENALQVSRRKIKWRPGAFCDVESLRHSNIVEQLGAHALNSNAVLATLRAIIHMPALVAQAIGSDEAFVRPDSPLKQFSGRTLTLDASVTLEDFDFGCYFDDIDASIVVAKKRDVFCEWRFVVVGGTVVTHSGYDAATRSGTGSIVGRDVIDFASMIAEKLTMVDGAYMLDVCETVDGLRVVEVNPFSGSDIYGCDPEAIISSVAAHCKIL